MRLSPRLGIVTGKKCPVKAWRLGAQIPVKLPRRRCVPCIVTQRGRCRQRRILSRDSIIPQPRSLSARDLLPKVNHVEGVKRDCPSKAVSPLNGGAGTMSRFLIRISLLQPKYHRILEEPCVRSRAGGRYPVERRGVDIAHQTSRHCQGWAFAEDNWTGLVQPGR